MDDTFESGHLMSRPILNEHSKKTLTKIAKQELNDVFLPKPNKEKEQRKEDQKNPLLKEM